MKRTLTIFILLFNYLAHAQSDSLPDMLIRYSGDSSIIITAYQNPNINSINSDSVDNKKFIDTLIDKYTLDFGFYADSIYPGLIIKQIVLDSVTFSELLIKSKLIMSQVRYGYGGAQNYGKLTEKYGVRYYAGGCVYNPHEIERQYSRYMRRLLTIRNGSNWEEKYKKEASKKINANSIN